MPVTNITGPKQFAANESLKFETSNRPRTNSLLIKRNQELDRLIWEGLCADGRLGEGGEMDGEEMEGGRTEEI